MSVDVTPGTPSSGGAPEGAPDSAQDSPQDPTIDVRDAVTSASAGPSPSAAVTSDLAAPVPTPRDPLAQRAWTATWPKLLAVALFIGIWQVVVWAGWKPTYLLPAPLTVIKNVGTLLFDDAKFWPSAATTLRRALSGFALAMAVGTLIGLGVSRFRVLRAGVGSLITGLQTMPSIVWFPLAILLFGATETAITFVVILGAAPSIANGLISGIDHVPPAFTRLGRVLGAKGWQQYRYVVLPAALPSYIAGLNQGWAFAWRSLMAGELLVIIANRPSIGSRLGFAQEFGNSVSLLSYMVIILIIGMLADFVFSSASRRMRRSRGLAVD